MELRHLRDFVAVAEELSFTRAAARLHLAQPSLTRQIKDLEEEIGVRLLDRSKGRVSLTEEGYFFLVEAKRVLALSSESVQMVQRLSRGETGQLNIGYIARLHSDLLPASLVAFRSAYSNVKLNLFNMTCQGQLEALESRDIDLGFVGLRDSLAGRGIEGECVGAYKIVVALPEGSAVSRKPKLGIKDLETLFFVGLSKKAFPGWHEWTVRVAAEMGYAPQILQEVDCVPAALEVVATGLGVTVLPEQIRTLPHAGVVFRSLTPEVRTEFCIAWWNGNRSKFLYEYIEILRSMAGPYLSETSGLAAPNIVHRTNSTIRCFAGSGFKRNGTASGAIRPRYQKAL